MTKSFAEHKNIPPMVAAKRKVKNSANVIPQSSIYSVDIKIHRAEHKVRIRRKVTEKESISRLPKKMRVEVLRHWKHSTKLADNKPISDIPDSQEVFFTVRSKIRIISKELIRIISGKMLIIF